MTKTHTDPQNAELQQYLQDVNQFHRADRELNMDLAKRYAEGDESALEQMVNANLRLVISVVCKHFSECPIPMPDLCQEGNIALMEAAKTFDYTTGNSFSTYAYTCVYNHLVSYLNMHASLIPVSDYTGKQIRKLKKARTRLLEETGAEPTLEVLAKELNLPEEKVQELLILSMEVYSLDKPLGNPKDDSETSLGQTEEAPSSARPEETLAKKELQRLLSELLSRLDPRQQTILRLYFGLEDGVCHSLEDIAREMRISKERVRQLKNKAMERLQAEGSRYGLEDYLP